MQRRASIQPYSLCQPVSDIFESFGRLNRLIRRVVRKQAGCAHRRRDVTRMVTFHAALSLTA